MFFFAPCSRRKPSRTPASVPTPADPSNPPAEQAAAKTDVVEKEVADTSSGCDTATPEVQQRDEQQKQEGNGDVKESKVVEKKDGEVGKKDVEAEKKPGELEKEDGEPEHEEGTKEDVVVEEDAHDITPVSYVLCLFLVIARWFGSRLLS